VGSQCTVVKYVLSDCLRRLYDRCIRSQTCVTWRTASFRNCVGPSLPKFSGILSRTSPKLNPPYLNCSNQVPFYQEKEEYWSTDR